MAVKTDISKAYNILEWQFLRDTVHHMGFDNKWIRWIMKYVESVTFSTLINGTPVGMITPERGISQGDPLSPYLFILCSEVLSHLLQKAEASKKLKGMKISNIGPKINHLLFSDDALFFCHAHTKSCSTIMNILSEYKLVSGQAVNLHKSAITFGSKVDPHMKTRLRRILNIHNDGGCGKYLGLPEQIGRKKKEIFDFIVEKVKKTTNGWSNRLLSDAGKEILIKTVALALPVYTMYCFKLPKGIFEDINGLLAKFWWKKGTNRRSMHWLAWKRLALPKKEGGLGFRDIEHFNVEMLAKQVSRVLQTPTSLLSRLLKGRYFADSNILDAPLGKKPSFVWRSLMEGRDLLKKGMRFLIGNGKKTNIWKDPRIPAHPPRAATTIENRASGFTSVNELINEDTKTWNLDLLEEFIVPEDVALIKDIKLSSQSNSDLLGWHYTKTGFYTVKSGYWLSTHLQNNIQDFNPPAGSEELKKAAWRVKTTPKIRHFLWRLITKTIGVKSILYQRRILRDPICSKCNAFEETPDHLFFTCQHASNIWRGTVFSHSGLLDSTIPFTEKLKMIMEYNSNTNLSNLHNQLPLWILWRIWKSRNMLFYQGRTILWQMDIQKAITEPTEWADTRSTDDSHQNTARQQTQQRSSWKKPNIGYIKCNYKCRLLGDGRPSKAAWILRDENGFFLEATIDVGQKCTGPLEAELQALLLEMQQVWNKGYKNVVFEGENKLVKRLTEGSSKNFGLHNWVRDINLWKERFSSVYFQWTPRNNNMVADRLAKEDISDSLIVNYQYVPSFIVNLLHKDHIKSY